MAVDSGIHLSKRRLTRVGSQWGGLHIDLDLVPDRGLVLSAGLARDITFDVELIERKNCTIVGIDPTRRSAKTVLWYKIRHPRSGRQLKLLRRAVHGRSGLVTRLGGAANTSLSPTGEKARTISLDDLLLSYPGAAMLKLDIEGAEFPAVHHLTTQVRIPQIAIGFHAWLNGDSDQSPTPGVPPGLYTAEHVREAVARIKAMGYKLVYEERDFEDRIGQETLFIRHDFAQGYADLDL